MGRCATCQTALECQRYLASRPPQERTADQESGTWADLLFTECPQCHARVYLVPKKAV